MANNIHPEIAEQAFWVKVGTRTYWPAYVCNEEDEKRFSYIVARANVIAQQFFDRAAPMEPPLPISDPNLLKVVLFGTRVFLYANKKETIAYKDMRKKNVKRLRNLFAKWLKISIEEAEGFMLKKEHEKYYTPNCACCGSPDGEPTRIILCCRCSSEHHLDCLKLNIVPDYLWFCEKCHKEAPNEIAHKMEKFASGHGKTRIQKDSLVGRSPVFWARCPKRGRYFPARTATAEEIEALAEPWDAAKGYLPVKMFGPDAPAAPCDIAEDQRINFTSHFTKYAQKSRLDNQQFVYAMEEAECYMLKFNRLIRPDPHCGYCGDPDGDPDRWATCTFCDAKYHYKCHNIKTLHVPPNFMCSACRKRAPLLSLAYPSPVATHRFSDAVSNSSGVKFDDSDDNNENNTSLTKSSSDSNQINNPESNNHLAMTSATSRLAEEAKAMKVFWARTGNSAFWPARHVDQTESKTLRAKNIHENSLKVPGSRPKHLFQVYYFGSHDFGWASPVNMLAFHANKEKYDKRSKAFNFRLGLEEAEEFLLRSKQASAYDPRCPVCLKQDGNPDRIIICDRCSLEYDFGCVGIKAVPEGEWFCPTCVRDAPLTVEFSKRVVTEGDRLLAPTVMDEGEFEQIDDTEDKQAPRSHSQDITVNSVTNPIELISKKEENNQDNNEGSGIAPIRRRRRRKGVELLEDTLLPGDESDSKRARMKRRKVVPTGFKSENNGQPEANNVPVASTAASIHQGTTISEVISAPTLALPGRISRYKYPPTELPPVQVTYDSRCFICKHPNQDPENDFIQCRFHGCPRVYHSTCLGGYQPINDLVDEDSWICPWHVCSVCGTMEVGSMTATSKGGHDMLPGLNWFKNLAKQTPRQIAKNALVLPEEEVNFGKCFNCPTGLCKRHLQAPQVASCFNAVILPKQMQNIFHKSGCFSCLNCSHPVLALVNPTGDVKDLDIIDATATARLNKIIFQILSRIIFKYHRLSEPFIQQPMADVVEKIPNIQTKAKVKELLAKDQLKGFMGIFAKLNAFKYRNLKTFEKDIESVLELCSLCFTSLPVPDGFSPAPVDDAGCTIKTLLDQAMQPHLEEINVREAIIRQREMETLDALRVKVASTSDAVEFCMFPSLKIAASLSSMKSLSPKTFNPSVWAMHLAEAQFMNTSKAESVGRQMLDSSGLDALYKAAMLGEDNSIASLHASGPLVSDLPLDVDDLDNSPATEGGAYFRDQLIPQNLLDVLKVQQQAISKLGESMTALRSRITEDGAHLKPSVGGKPLSITQLNMASEYRMVTKNLQNQVENLKTMLHIERESKKRLASELDELKSSLIAHQVNKEG